MSALPTILAIARADFRERVRRYSFLVTLFFAVFLGYCAATGKIYIRLDDYRGVYTSAWIGTMVTLVTTSFVSLVGFYVIKNAVDRDRVTGVGQILATTPMSKPAYMIGKFLSNFAVLLSMVGVLAVSAMVMQFVAGEDPHFDLAALLSPFLVLAVPAFALVAAMALLFEALPLLRGGFGNVLWFFVWGFGFGLPEITKLPWLDPMGLMTVARDIMAEAHKAIPGYKNSFSLTIDFQPVQIAESLRYHGMNWTADLILLRLFWTGAAFLIVLLAALFFDRFDPARWSARSVARVAKANRVEQRPAAVPTATAGFTAARLTPLLKHADSSAFGRLLVAELRLALQGYRWWWYAVALVLVFAQLVTPLAISRGPLLTVAWVWPVLIWSGMGAREARFGTSALLFSSARILPRQLPACFAAGFLVAALTGAGSAIRLLLAGEGVGFLAWCVGAAFLPALALALGVLTGTSKFFEGLYVAWWYVGPLNHVPGFDFTGSANGSLTLRYVALYLLLTATLLVIAFTTRARQLRHA